MDDQKSIKGVKIGALILTILGTIGTAWVTSKENKQKIDKAVDKYMKTHKELNSGE